MSRLRLRCKHCGKRWRGSAQEIKQDYYDHTKKCAGPDEAGFFMPKPRIVVDGGYFYMLCDLHDTDREKAGDRVGVRSHVAAMNIGAVHYELRHKTLKGKK